MCESNHDMEHGDRANGVLRITVDKRNDAEGKSYVAQQYYKLPLQIMPPHYQDHDGTVFLYFLNPSGGVLQGDNLSIEVVLKKNASAYITTPSASKIYRMEDGCAIQKAKFILHEGSVLEYFPDYTVPYKGSKYAQQNDFFIRGNARLITCDILTAGRIARGEIFQFDHFYSANNLYIGERLAVSDRMKIEPSQMNIGNETIMQGYCDFASVYAYADQVDADLAGKIYEILRGSPNISGGVSMPEDHLLVIKILASKVRHLQETIFRVWNCLRTNILHKEAVVIRKY